MAIGNMHKKFGVDRMCSSKDMITDKQTHTHTERETRYNTLLPYQGHSNKGKTINITTTIIILQPLYRTTHVRWQLAPPVKNQRILL